MHPPWSIATSTNTVPGCIIESISFVIRCGALSPGINTEPTTKSNKGWKKACKDNPALALGLNIVEGKIVYKAVADVFGLKYEPVSL